MRNLRRRSHRVNEKAKDASDMIQESISGLIDSNDNREVQRALYVCIQIVEGYSKDDKELSLMKRYKKLL